MFRLSIAVVVVCLTMICQTVFADSHAADVLGAFTKPSKDVNLPHRFRTRSIQFWTTIKMRQALPSLNR